MSTAPRPRPTRATAGALAAALVAGVAGPARAGAPTAVVSGLWQLEGGRPVVVVPLDGVLTVKQRSMLEGGFTTVSELALYAAVPSEDDDETTKPAPLLRVPCSVKFDAWEETYEVTRFGAAPVTTMTRDFAGYARPCLSATLASSAALDRLQTAGGTLGATLVVKQTSPEEAKQIKDWLVKQQSGVMQGLFSHMLGELTLNQSVDVAVQVAPKPRELGVQPAPPVKAAAKPKAGRKE
jgi:hypothetical protein